MKYFQISFTNNKDLTSQAQNIQFNIFEKIKNLKYINFSRINIIFTISNEECDEFKITGFNHNICNIYANICLKEGFSVENVTLRTFDLLEELFKEKGWSVSDLLDAIDRIKKEKFKVIIPYIKRKWTSNRSLSAEVIINYKINYAEFVFISYEKTKKISCKKVLIRARLNPMLFRRFLKEGVWLSENIYCVVDELEEINFIVDIEKCKLTIKYYPNDNTVIELKSFLKALNYKTTDEESMKIFGFPPQFKI